MMRLLLLHALIVVVIDAINSQSSSIETHGSRTLDSQTLNYRANYSADFQYLRDASCFGDAPILRVSCFGRSMTILGTSDKTIICTQMEEPVIPDGTSYQCNNTCSGTSCKSVYLAHDGNGMSSGTPFGSIRYLCEGNSVDEVDSIVTHLGGRNGTCTATSSVTSSSSQNIHVARLGVSCPVGLTREYVYEDTYFECDTGTLGSVSFDGLPDPFDLYTCSEGSNCNGESCNVAFQDFSINAEVPEFLDECVEAMVPITVYPSLAPVQTSTGSIVSAQFEASWGNLYDSEQAMNTCTMGNPLTILSCENGASIEYLRTTDSTVVCTLMNETKLQCASAASTVVNRFSSVAFVSLV
jgi:hypothetical protein